MGNDNTTLEQEPIMNNNVNSLDKNDKIGISKYDDSYGKFETTITGVKEFKSYYLDKRIANSNKFEIECLPHFQDGHLYIYKNNPDFVDIHNKIRIGQTYNIIFKNIPVWGFASVNNSVVDILPPTINTLATPIKGFINIEDELNISNYHEVITNNTNNKIRLLIPSDKKDDIIVGQTYYLTYSKAWKSNLYKVTNYELQ